LLEKGKTTLLGKGTKLRNFMAVRDVAQFAVIALTGDKLKNQTLELGGPQNFTNTQVAELYGRLAVARAMSVVLKPFQPGLSRVMYINSLPDDAFDKTFDPTKLLQDYHPVQLTTLEEFVRERIEETKR
jgi:nucleoside-diphosphate-sugar epimerase